MLSTCSHVFIRVDAVRRPLSPPYEGPFLVRARGPKTFTVEKSGKPYVVTIDRLKPAAVLDVSFSPSPVAVSAGPERSSPSTSPSPSPPLPSSALDPDSWPLPTRYGRRPRPPTHLNL